MARRIFRLYPDGFVEKRRDFIVRIVHKLVLNFYTLPHNSFPEVCLSWDRRAGMTAARFLHSRRSLSARIRPSRRHLAGTGAIFFAQRQGLISFVPSLRIWNCACLLLFATKTLWWRNSARSQIKARTMLAAIPATSVIRFIVFPVVSAAYFMFFA